RPQFADFIAIVEGAARGAFEFLGLRYDSFEITGCWANVNPQGGLNSSHNHPNNYLSGVYYVSVPPGTGQIVFADPRPQAGVMVPTTDRYNKKAHRKQAPRRGQGGRDVPVPRLAVPLGAGQPQRSRADQHQLQRDVHQLHGDHEPAALERHGADQAAAVASSGSWASQAR